MSAELDFAVGDDDTAIALGSGDVAVLATPRLLAWCEAATVRAVASGLEPGTTTVGMRVQMDHLAPTPVGGAVRTAAELEKVEGRRLTFAVTAHDDGQLVADGRITRVVVDVDRFLARRDDRLNSPG